MIIKATEDLLTFIVFFLDETVIYILIIVIEWGYDMKDIFINLMLCPAVSTTPKWCNSGDCNRNTDIY